jgi:hypothetical protein
MIELSGLQEGQDIDITYTGLRPGEKMYEELFVAGETHQPTIHPKIQVAVRAVHHSSSQNVVESDHTPLVTDLDRGVDALLQAAYEDDEQAIVHLLQAINPLYCPLRPEQHNKEGHGDHQGKSYHDRDDNAHSPHAIRLNLTSDGVDGARLG